MKESTRKKIGISLRRPEAQAKRFETIRKNREEALRETLEESNYSKEN